MSSSSVKGLMRGPHRLPCKHREQARSRRGHTIKIATRTEILFSPRSHLVKTPTDPCSCTTTLLYITCPATNTLWLSDTEAELNVLVENKPEESD